MQSHLASIGKGPEQLCEKCRINTLLSSVSSACLRSSALLCVFTQRSVSFGY